MHRDRNCEREGHQGRVHALRDGGPQMDAPAVTCSAALPTIGNRISPTHSVEISGCCSVKPLIESTRNSAVTARTESGLSADHRPSQLWELTGNKNGHNYEQSGSDPDVKLRHLLLLLVPFVESFFRPTLLGDALRGLEGAVPLDERDGTTLTYIHVVRVRSAVRVQVRVGEELERNFDRSGRLLVGSLSSCPTPDSTHDRPDI